MNITHIIFWRPWLFDRKVHNDIEANTYTLSWNGKGVGLIRMKSIAPSPSTSSPSTDEPQKEHNIEREIMVDPQVKTEDIKDNIEEQFQSKANFVGTNNVDQGSVTQELQRVEEVQDQTNIEDCDQVSKKIEHPVDLTVMPLPGNPIASSEIKSIAPVVSQVD